MTMYYHTEQDDGGEMKILYILHGEPDGTMENFTREQEKSSQVAVFDLRVDKNYALLMDMIETSDKVISW